MALDSAGVLVLIGLMLVGALIFYMATDQIKDNTDAFCLKTTNIINEKCYDNIDYNADLGQWCWEGNEPRKCSNTWLQRWLKEW